MAITFDAKKRAATLAERGLDFKDAEIVFAGTTFEAEDNRKKYGETRMICFEVEDNRKKYGETRMICFGVLRGRFVVIGYTPRGADRHVFSMRKANDREKARIAPLLGL